tara:strand:- start:44264 stop:44449 length:186 start_codon:yes stop_codon:yes gene_type:complete
MKSVVEEVRGWPDVMLEEDPVRQQAGKVIDMKVWNYVDSYVAGPVWAQVWNQVRTEMGFLI